jgi:hypothetical protein
MTYQNPSTKIAFAVLLLLLIPIISAGVNMTYPASSIISINPSNPSQTVEFTNQNLSETVSVSLSLSSELQNELQLSSSSIIIDYRNSIIISTKTNAPNGTFSGSLNYQCGNQSSSIPISLFIPNPTQNITSNPSDIIIFPTTKTVTVQQGESKTQNIMLTVPQSYPRTITIQSVDFNPGTDTITFGDLNLGQVAPGQSIQIPIIFNGKNAQTGTYSTGLTIFALDPIDGRINLPQITLTLQVSVGVSPVTNDTFSTPPTCSLSATTLNPNQTYSFTCSNQNSNIEINPEASDYFEGKSVDISPGIFKYIFIPLKTGDTTFKASFSYKGAPIYSPFHQDVRITNAGSTTPGTDLQFHFTPSLDDLQGIGTVLVQILDNKTSSLVINPRLWINSVEINSTSDTFSYTFNTDTSYELRAKASGYDDYTKNFLITPKPVSIIINPLSGDSGTSFNITTNPGNLTLRVNGNEVTNPFYNKLSPGLNVIEASGKGYKTTYINITVQDYIRIISGGENFSKGKNKLQVFYLSQNVSSFTVYYQKSAQDTGPRENYLTNTTSGNVIKFTPKKAGLYYIEADGKPLGSFQINGFDLDAKFIFLPMWGWIIILVIFIIIVILVIVFHGKGDSSGGEMPPMTYQAGSG